MDELGTVRIGDTERQAIVEALTAHRESGRLDPTEFEDRQVEASRARTWSDVAPLFADLPEPHPVGMPRGLPLTLAGTGGVTGPATPGAPVPGGWGGQGLLGNVVPPRYRDTVMAITPFAAVALFFITRTWLWFLMIPVMGILLYGPEGKKGRRDRR